MSTERKVIRLHEKQGLVFASRKRNIVALSGKQGGKTTVGGLWARLQMSRFMDKADNAIIAAPDYKIFSQSTFPKFQEYFHGYGKLDKKEMAFRVNGGGTIFLRSMHDPDSCEGITRVRWIWADEAGKLKGAAATNLEGRAAFSEAQSLYTTTPYNLGWLYKNMYKAWRAGKRPDMDFFQWKSIDNPYFPKAEYARLKEIMDPRVFSMHFEGQFQKMAGLVFMDFDESLNMTDPHDAWKNKQNWYVCAGVDWGYTNPFAITVRAIHRHEPRDHQIAEHYQSYLTPSDKVTIAKDFQKRYGIEHFFCDNEEPASIEEFNRAGLKATGAPKYPGSLKDNIEMHNELIRSRVYKVFRGRCKHTEEEYETYHFPEEDGDEENSSENPVDANNHLMTANMYVTQCTKDRRRHIEKLRTFVPEKTHEQRLRDREFAPHNIQSNEWFDR